MWGNKVAAYRLKNTVDSTKCHFSRIESMAGAVQGRPGAPVRVSASGQALDRVVQRQPARTPAGGGGRLPAGRPGSRSGPLQGPGAGWRHDKVSRLGRGFWPADTTNRSTRRKSFQKVTPSPCRILCFESSKRRRADSISKSASAKTGQSKGRTHDPERKRKR